MLAAWKMRSDSEKEINAELMYEYFIESVQKQEFLLPVPFIWPANSTSESLQMFGLTRMGSFFALSALNDEDDVERRPIHARMIGRSPNWSS